MVTDLFPGVRNSTKQECPVEGCRKEHDTSFLMCTAHWHMLPKPMRMAVNHAWRARKAALGTHNYQGAKEAHEELKREAVETINKEVVCRGR